MYDNDVDMMSRPNIRITDALHREITKRADRLIDALNLLQEGDDTYRATGRKAYIRLAQDSADRARDLLRDITSWSRSDPRRLLFFTQLSSRPRTGLPLEAIEDSLYIASKYKGETMYTVRGKGGIEDIFESDRIPELRRSPLELPDDFDDSPWGPLAGHPLEHLEQVLLSLPAGPDLFNHLLPYDHDKLSFSDYPRLTQMLPSVIGALCSTRGVTPSELTMVEYGPRLAIGTMIAGARMGLNVQWQDVKPQNSFHTMQEIDRLPDSLRTRITNRDDDSSAGVDCAVWNFPWPIPFDELAQDVVPGGMMLIQTEQKIDGVPNQGWTPHANIKISDGTYILPSAYLYVVHGEPSFFQIWQRAFA